MLFTAPWFLVFTIGTLGLYLLSMGSARARRWLLLLVSVGFYYHFAGLPGLLVVVALAVLVYAAGLAAAARASLRWTLTAAILASVAALVYFKYTPMIAETVAGALGTSPADGVAGLVNAGAAAFVPLGISFFAFEFCHYLADIIKGAKPVRDPLCFAIVVFFYPRIAAGPIVRFPHIIPQLERMPAARQEDVIFGLRRIGSGFAKKVFIADPVAWLLTHAYITQNVICGSDVIYLSLLLYVRIYMDFSAYSDMAIGLARLWGIRVNENFRFPFLATSPSNFWRRWHISLSTWIRDYIYIPLGGARVPPARKALNLLAAMALCGLWHGPAWHFVVWGVFHGVLLLGGRAAGAAIGAVLGLAWVERAPGLASGLGVVAKGFGWLTTQTAVALSWLIFFYPLPDVVTILGKIAVNPIVPALFK